ncbi:MAG: alpha/beta-hydrolase family protein [Balneolaceae bacterium]
MLKRYFSTTGLLIGTLFFALSMSPTLIPRPDTIQGILSGFALASGYGLGVFGIWIWKYFELPEPKEKSQRTLQIIAGSFFLLITVISLWRATIWQNSLRQLMGMEADAFVQPVVVGLIAILVFLSLLLIGRLFLITKQFLARKMENYVPPRVSFVLGLLTTFILFWLIVNGVLVSQLVRMADSTYQQIDALIEPDHEKPTNPMKTGSEASILSWEEMGSQGRRFLAEAPSSENFQNFTDSTVMDPIRVYVGMHASENFQERAELALNEMIRVGAFERSVLLLITPTGTGWIDPASIEPAEYLHKGNIASVAAQYSYLPSPLSLIAEEDYGSDMARALFQKVYDYWSSLPIDSRPKLYLHGLSLGALNSDHSFDFYDIIEDPFHGVLWVGPPFRKTTWRNITENRNEGSPAWLPRFRDGSVVRFANQDGGLEIGEDEWGSFRIAYLQYASDPIIFFDPSIFTYEPDWIKPPRGPDVSPYLRWYPIVTGIQVAADLLTGIGSTPPGFGHEYAADHYFDSWHSLTEPEGWNEQEIDSLRKYFENRRHQSDL